MLIDNNIINKQATNYTEATDKSAFVALVLALVPLEKFFDGSALLQNENSMPFK